MRWPILLGVMRMEPKTAAKIMMTCIIMHNFIINTGGGFIENVGTMPVVQEGVAEGGVIDAEGNPQNFYGIEEDA